MYIRLINISEVFELATDYKKMPHDKAFIENNIIRSEMLLDRVTEMLNIYISNVTGILK